MNKRIVSIFGALAIVVGACSSSGGSPAASSGDGAGASSGTTPYISIVSKGFQHQFWQAVKQGAEEEAAKLGASVNFMGPDTESNIDQQLNMLQTELAKKPAALCFAALDSQAATPLLQQFQSQNIPVIAFDSGVDSDIPMTTVATDNVAAAALAADKMAAAIGNSGKVGVIIHDQTSRTGIDRSDGFVNQMKEKYPDIEIIGPQYGGGDQAKSADLAKSMLQANPDMKGFFGGNEGSIIGVLNAVDELHLNGKLTVIGYDSGQKQIDSINAGTELGAVQQNPIGIGAKCVEYAMKAINGETGFDKVVDTGFIWADKTNIDSAEVQAVLYK